jgi:subtilisin-like proprotein convertase family protein
MKTILIAVLLLGAAGWAEATLVQQTFNVSGGAIADGNPVGQVFTGTFNQAATGNQVLGITVNLSVSGGYNGNLYAYLVAPNGTLVLLLDRPGSGVGNPLGYAGSGFNNITLSDVGTQSLQTTVETPGVAVPTGTYSAAGTLGTFNSSVANGKWELFFADMVKGGGTSTLNSWSLNITVVPEPVTLALGLFAAMLLALAGVRHFWRA